MSYLERAKQNRLAALDTLPQDGDAPGTEPETRRPTAEDGAEIAAAMLDAGVTSGKTDPSLRG